jgi:hypothetical protein
MPLILKAEDIEEEQANLIYKKSISYRGSIIRNLIKK